MNVHCRVLQVVKTNMAIYRTQKVVDSKIADSVFISHALELFNGFPDCVRVVHDKLGSVFRVN